MDPASIFGIISACAGLVKLCASITSTLWSLNETYKGTELSIIALLDECESIRFAWACLEEWASTDASMMRDQEHLVHKLKRSIYTGELIMDAFEQDLTKVTPKTNTFKRGVTFVWNEGDFQIHQARIRGQTGALQLLLQVISMPRSQDRAETLSVKDHVFRDVDESVLSIVPSRFPSTSSRAESSRSSDGSEISNITSYKPFSFESTLFTSHVYKRNYRSSDRLPQLRPISERPDLNNSDQPDHCTLQTIRSDSTGLADDYTTIFSKRQLVPFDCVTEPPKPSDLVLPGHADIGMMDGGTSGGLSKDKAIEAVGRRHFHAAIRRFRTGLDIAWIVHPTSKIEFSILKEFFVFMECADQSFFTTAVLRLCYSAGTHWLVNFRDSFPLGETAYRKHCQLPPETWTSFEKAAKAHDLAYVLAASPDQIPSLLQFACAGGDPAVVSYLLRVGFQPPSEIYNHLVFLARILGNKAIEALFSEDGLPKSHFLWGFQALLAEQENKTIWWFRDGLPFIIRVKSMLAVFINHVDLSASPESRMPLIHHLIATEPQCRRSNDRLEFSLLLALNKGADVNTPIRMDWQGLKSPCISPLAYAIMLRRLGMVKILCDKNAKLIWPQLKNQSNGLLPNTSLMGAPVKRLLEDVRMINTPRRLSMDRSETSTLYYVDLIELLERSQRLEGESASSKRSNPFKSIFGVRMSL
ncbi:hypothetical protein K491DRAFT_777583 [Lophiostoma macrostomum CBS 122681]|uniref:Ankyrin n=1 Tax=Lophiostoma macrostomum CBS 122681 TaxID=1314788 RepID=A0A6A6TBL1_9PLEO|nr:hypothetical protein K491DRAFT_777583 [Lophiostoma macrostomum CBS 122681]